MRRIEGSIEWMHTWLSWEHKKGHDAKYRILWWQHNVWRHCGSNVQWNGMCSENIVGYIKLWSTYAWQGFNFGSPAAVWAGGNTRTLTHGFIFHKLKRLLLRAQGKFSFFVACSKSRWRKYPVSDYCRLQGEFSFFVACSKSRWRKYPVVVYCKQQRNWIPLVLAVTVAWVYEK